MDVSAVVRTVKNIFTKDSNSLIEQEMVTMPPQPPGIKGKTFEKRNVHVSYLLSR